VADPKDAGSLETAFVTVFWHFVRDYILTDWEPKCPRDPGPEPRSTAADDFLLATAKEAAVPLITNEGYGVGGVRDVGLRKKAKEASVPVYIPADFYKGKLDEAEATEWFLRSFREKAPEYLKAKEADGHANVAGLTKVLGIMFDIYEHVLVLK
jgi:hypothetical protein